jgi:hypothetical protein
MTLGSAIRAGPFRSDSSIEQDKRGVLLASDPTENNLHFNILVSSRSSKSPAALFLSEVYEENISITIPSSDWVNDFQEKLGLGKFMVVEIPQLTTDLKGINDASLGDDEQELRSRLLVAFENLGIIENKIKKAEWKEAAEACRATIEPFTKGTIRSFIKEMIKQQSGIEEKNASQLMEAFSRIYDYSSGLIHVINQKDQKVTTQYKGGKEDAYMNYMILAAMINTVARKFIGTVNNNKT